MLQPSIDNREPVKRNYGDLDSLISELGKPKEEIIPTPQSTAFSSSPGAEPIPGNSSEESALEPIPAEIAQQSGKVIAGTIDAALSTGLSIYAKNNSAEKYEATDKQMQKLTDAWTAVAQKYNYKVEDSPWFNAILLNFAVYFPRIKDAQEDRRIKELELRQRELELRVKEAQDRLDNIENKKAS